MSNLGIIQDPQDFLDALDAASFSYRDILGRDVWTKFDPSFSGLTTVGTLAALGRLRITGRKTEFQVAVQATTSIASTAGTTYLVLPIPQVGYYGMATMTNATTNIAVGVCSVTNGACYLPAQLASGNLFGIAGWCET